MTRHREARGRSMQVRPGRVAFHDAILTALPCRFSLARRCAPDGCSCARAAGIPVASSALPLVDPRSAKAMRELEGRQDRFRGGPVKDVRFFGPRYLPPSDARSSFRAEARAACGPSSETWAFT
jgi:hypothetical protein